MTPEKKRMNPWRRILLLVLTVAIVGTMSGCGASKREQLEKDTFQLVLDAMKDPSNLDSLEKFYEDIGVPLQGVCYAGTPHTEENNSIIPNLEAPRYDVPAELIPSYSEDPYNTDIQSVTTSFPATEDGIAAAVDSWVAHMERTSGLTFKEYSIDPIVYDDGTCYFQVYAEGFEYPGYMDPETGDLFTDEAMTNYLDQDLNRGWLDGWLETGVNDLSDEVYGYEESGQQDLPTNYQYPIPIKQASDIIDDFLAWAKGKNIKHLDLSEILINAAIYGKDPEYGELEIFYGGEKQFHGAVNLKTGIIYASAKYDYTIDDYCDYYHGFRIGEEWGRYERDDFLNNFGAYRFGRSELPEGIEWVYEPFIQVGQLGDKHICALVVNNSQYNISTYWYEFIATYKNGDEVWEEICRPGPHAAGIILPGDEITLSVPVSSESE